MAPKPQDLKSEAGSIRNQHSKSKKRRNRKEKQRLQEANTARAGELQNPEVLKDLDTLFVPLLNHRRRFESFCHQKQLLALSNV
jgi:hypothetical protein